jgi:hypothetical protein
MISRVWRSVTRTVATAVAIYSGLVVPFAVTFGFGRETPAFGMNVMLLLLSVGVLMFESARAVSYEPALSPAVAN